MSNPKILNLDEIETPTDKVLVLNKVRHHFEPPTVEDFIAQLKEMEDNEKRDEIPVSEYIEQMIKVITRAFPTLPEAEVRKLKVDRLRAITDFVRGETEREALAGASEAGIPEAAEGEGAGESR